MMMMRRAKVVVVLNIRPSTEPFDLTNTARSVYDPETFEKIVATFRDSYARLAAGLRLADAWPQPQPQPQQPQQQNQQQQPQR